MIINAAARERTFQLQIHNSKAAAKWRKAMADEGEAPQGVDDDGELEPSELGTKKQ